jgi:predicted HAD superfamily Cof-like phosphohydrolase
MRNSFNLNSLFVMVRDWNKRTGHMPDTDAEANLRWFLDVEYRNRAMDLLTEEVGEMKDAIDAMNQVEMLDAAADIIFVLAGIIEKAGLGEYMDEVMVEVLKSNNSKIPPFGEVIRDANGKIGKPEGYRAPDIPEAMRIVDRGKDFRRYDSAETDD